MIEYSETKRRRVSAVLAGLFLLFGSAGATLLVVSRPEAPRRPTSARVLNVAAVRVASTLETTPVVGHGTVRAKHELDIVPQVTGKLTFVHPELAVGNVIQQGDVLFEIDSTVYESRRRQAEAEIKRLEASLERIKQESVSLDERIRNVEQMLAIDESDYETSKELFDKEHVGTRRDVDLVFQKFLRQRDAYYELTSRRGSLPHLALEMEAQLEAAQARLRQAQHEVENTRITCPFKARVEDVSAYTSQVVTAFFAIAKLTDMSAFELSVGIDPTETRWLAEAIQPDTLVDSNRAEAQSGPEVTVRWSLRDQALTWRGHVTRFERVDESTRTPRLVVEIRDVDMRAMPVGASAGEGMMLAIGMHLKAELPVRKLEGALTVPRHAIHDNRMVFVVEPDPADPTGRTGRLAARAVPILRSLGDEVLVDFANRPDDEPCELKAGELVVVSPLMKPVPGMAVQLRDQVVAGEPVLPTFGASDSMRVARIVSFLSHPEPVGLVSGG
jgi:multidrug efflux pump subunit AcrA (membrane-fusion protein)